MKAVLYTLAHIQYIGMPVLQIHIMPAHQWIL